MARLDPTGVSRILSYIKNWVTTALGGKANSSHSHTKSQITDFPTIPSKTSQLTNDSGFLTAHQSLSNYSTLANTVKSISISGKTITVTPGSGSAYTLTTQDTNTTYSNFVKSGSGAKAGLVPAPSTTAGTTKYLREDGTWQVPPDHTYTVNNATLTIQKNGSNVATFTSNASSNVTANITVPTKTSQLTNDSGFITGISWDNVSGKPSAFTPYFANGTWYAVGDDAAIGDHNVGGGLGVKALNSTTTRIDFCYKDDASNYKSITYDGTTLYMNGNCNYANSAGSVAWSNVTGKPTIPTNTNQLTNGAGYITSSGSCSSSTYSTYLNSLGAQTPKSGRDIFHSGVYTYTTYTDTNTPAHYGAVIGYGNGQGGSCEMFAEWVGKGNLWFRVLRDCDDSWTNWQQIITSNNIGSQSVNYANSAGGVAWGNVSGKPSTFAPSSHIHTTIEGTYSGNGGKQGPSYYGKNRVGFLMSNESVNGDSCYKNWLYMDNYSADDVGGATAIGVDRMHAKAFIMQSSAARSAWNESAELLSSRHLGTAMGTVSFKITRNGITSPGWYSDGANSSVLQVCTTDNTEPSICFHRSGHSHVVLGEQNGELITHQQGGTPSRINHDGWTTLNGYRIYVG